MIWVSLAAILLVLVFQVSSISLFKASSILYKIVIVGILLLNIYMIYWGVKVTKANSSITYIEDVWPIIAVALASILFAGIAYTSKKGRIK